MDRILISGIREMGVHGVLPEEQVRPQPFEVDIELLVDVRAAGVSDDLDDTVDYSAVCDAVIRIAEACRADPRVVGVVVEVRKMHPPVRALLNHVAVRVER